MKGYRLDIDGLRAVAVLLVLGFHLKLEFLSGGHVGVDAFFVLSGFLITSILVSKFKAGCFSAREFYSRRIQRLFPALFATIFVTFVTSTLVLLPSDFEPFSRSAIASLFSFSNFIFWAESGYWDVSSEIKPLLHTWSLGVEEQFYLIWPLAILALIRLKIQLSRTLLVLTVLGIGLCYYYSLKDLSGAFYLLPSRVFQFSIGGMLAVLLLEGSGKALLKQSFVRDFILLSGLAMLMVAGVMLDETVHYPGLYALVPTLGAFLVIFSGSSEVGHGWLGKALLENRLLVWIGRISYSLYLAHWPIIVLYRYETGLELSLHEIGILTIVIFIAASLLHYGVERRFYARRFVEPSKEVKSQGGSSGVALVLSVGLLISVLPAHAWLTGGWAWRYPSLKYTNEEIDAAMEARQSYYRAECQVHEWPAEGRCSEKTGPTILFFGNSHEPDGYNFIRAGYAEQMKGMDVVNFGTLNDCSNLAKQGSDWQTDSPFCQQRLNSLFSKEFTSSLDIIVYSAHHTFQPWNEKGLQVLEDLKSINSDIKVAVIGDYLQTVAPCVSILNKTGSTQSCFYENNLAYNPSASTQMMYRKYRKMVDVYINRMKLLCENTQAFSCLSETEDGTPYSFDGHHNSLEFAEMSGKRFSAQVPGFFDELLEGEITNKSSLLMGGLDNITESEVQAKIQQLYIGLFGRPADKPGLDYWSGQVVEGAMSVEDVLSAMFDPNQAEFIQNYGKLNDTQLLQKIYHNLLGRFPEKDKLDYWIAQLESDTQTLKQLVAELILSINKVQPENATSVKDYSILSNKVLAAQYYTEKTKDLPFDDGSILTAKRSIKDVGRDPGSLLESNSLVDRYILSR